MGFFVHFRGEFTCVRCGQLTDARVQTKLLRTDAENCHRDYQVGDSEVMDGLKDYPALHAWDGSSPLSIVVGDWQCGHCDVAWQWARAIFDVWRRDTVPLVVLRELSTFQPWHASDFNGVHFVEWELLWAVGAWEGSNWCEGVGRWNTFPVTERCERVARGFREWCREAVGVTLSRPSPEEPAAEESAERVARPE